MTQNFRDKIALQQLLIVPQNCFYRCLALQKQSRGPHLDCISKWSCVWVLLSSQEDHSPTSALNSASATALYLNNMVPIQYTLLQSGNLNHALSYLKKYFRRNVYR